MQLSDPYGRAATATIQWPSTASSRLKRTGRGTEHSTSTWCQGSECMAPSSTPQYVLMTCSFTSTGETWTCRFRLHGYVITTFACGRWNSNCALQCLNAQALSRNVQHFTWARHTLIKNVRQNVTFYVQKKKRQRYATNVVGNYRLPHTSTFIFRQK
jgi:hypothetical protein